LKLPPEASLEHTGSYVHRFSHIHWHNEVWIVKNVVEEGTWVSFEELEEEIALPTAFRPCVDILKR
ncbi:MAG: NUDIX domain-containing protein, partial [Erysipelotrichaceae bacterium]|nr:NUDIX domain-containing protein [Erysipelotrichaceae bacterium]